MNKKKTIFQQISKLTGLVNVWKDIIEPLLSIENFQKDHNYEAPKFLGESLHNIKDIWVDLDYQRKLELQNILNRLEECNGYKTEYAGFIDLAVRPDGKKCVWDGFHRLIMAAICGALTIPAAIYKHPKTRSKNECHIEEAKMFKVRNALRSQMKPEYIFKADLAIGDPKAKALLSLMEECGVTIAGTNKDKDAVELGGFSLFRKFATHDKRPTDIHFRRAADILKAAFPQMKEMSILLFCGLTQLLSNQQNDTAVETVPQSTIKSKFVQMVKDQKKKQKQFSEIRFHGKGIESVAFNIIKSLESYKVWNDNGEESKRLIKGLGFTDEHLDRFDEENEE